MKSVNRLQLEREGYCVFHKLIAEHKLKQIHAYCRQVLTNVTDEHRDFFKAQGCIADISDYPIFADVLSDACLTELFADLALPGYVFSSGSVISKPPMSPALFWHQDWWGWDDAISYSERILQVNLMIYLSPTKVENGCLRVIPGSHRRKHSLHTFDVAYGESMCRVENPEHPLYQSWSGEQAIEVMPGDIVVKDARLLHSTYSNASDAERTLLSLNFNPDFANLPERVQARITNIFMRDRVRKSEAELNGLIIEGWPESDKQKIRHLFPDSGHQAEPLAFNFRPDPELLLV